MIKYTFVVVGKIKEKYLEEAIKEYTKRMSKYAKISFVEINDENDSNQSIDKESEKILLKLDKRNYNILLDLGGEMLSSEKLAKKLDKLTLNYDNITYVIGGSKGVNEKVKEFVDYRLSFSKMTFPHQLMRVILLEQIYRTICINNNIKYHK